MQSQVSSNARHIATMPPWQARAFNTEVIGSEKPYWKGAANDHLEVSAIIIEIIYLKVALAIYQH